jgi:hypothetical protein
MLRTGVAVYLMFMSVAGPWFCCCTASRVGRWLDNFVLVEPESTQPPCCPCCKLRHNKKRSNSVHLEGETPDSQKPIPCHCPCREHRLNESRLLPLNSLALELVYSFTRCERGLESCVPLAIPLISASVHALSPDREDPLLPFLPAKAILHALHILRC